jgi:hypothetical protein
MHKLDNIKKIVKFLIFKWMFGDLLLNLKQTDFSLFLYR